MILCRISSTAPSSTERYFNETKREGSRNKLTNESNYAALHIGILLPVVLLGVVIAILGILFCKRRKKKGNFMTLLAMCHYFGSFKGT